MKFSAKVNPLESPMGKTVAFGSLIVDDLLVIDGFAIVNGSNGLFVSMPSKVDKEDPKKYHPTVKTLDWTEDNKSALRDEMCAAILAEYNSVTGNSTKASAANAKHNNAQKPPATKRAPAW